MKFTYCPAIATFVLLLCSGCSEGAYYTMEGYTQGGEYKITFDDTGSGWKKISHRRVASTVENILREVESTLSGYDSTSTVSAFNRSDKSIVANPILSELFGISRDIWEETDGMFDISGAPLFDYWGFGFKDPVKMQELRDGSGTPATVDSLLKFCGMQHLSLQRRGDEVSMVKDDPRTRVNFNAIAQGYTCDLIASAFDSIGIRNYLIDVGMEITCKGVNAKGLKWHIGIDAPIDGNMTAGQFIQDILEVSDCGIVTSGNYRKFFIGENGEKYAHSINPVTGYPSRDSLLSATVIAPDAAHADAYATFCMVIGYEKAVNFLESREDLHGYLITPNGVYKKL